jgi:hypothetical protein
MKNIIVAFYALVSIIFLSSCGVNQSIITNQNQNSTQIHLATNNYKVVEKISGSSDVTYIFLIGGLKRKQLYENAYSAMMTKANLLNSSKAVINLVTEEHVGGLPPFYVKRTLTVSGHVIEFTK